MSDDGTLTLADGTRISTATGRPVGLPGYTVVPTNTEAVREVTRVRRRLSELPDIPQGQLNITAVICTYHMFGLEPFEIAHAVGVTENQVNNIMMTTAFDELVSAMQQNIMDGEAEDVRSLISKNAIRAVTAMSDALTSQNEQNRIVAAKDILDRAGHRPADIIEHRHRIDGGLTIEYVKKGGEDDLPTIDLKAEDVTDGTSS